MSDLAPVVHVDRIDAEWMTHTLRAAGLLEGHRVEELRREPCGTGQLADSFRFTLSYDSPGAGPATLVGKFPSDDPNSRDFGRRSGYYRNEIRFYEEIATTLSIAVPTPVHAALADDDTEFVLLMEDLSPARIVDQLTGCTPDEAAVALEQIAAVHAGSWERDDLAAVDWLTGTVTSFHAVTDAFPGLTDSFSTTYGDLVPQSDIDEAAKLNAHLEEWKAVLSTPQCLWHSDLRADNLMFDVNGGQRPVALLDWQGVGYGRGTIDVAYFLGTSMTTEHRRTHERDLVNAYHDALVAGGVKDYPRDRCWEDYRLAAIHPLQTGVFGLGAVKRSARGDEMWRQWIARSAAQTRDLESFDVLAAR
jgi:aminoglycoside phosphotransferase (APT) family kinase protein